MCLQLTAKIKPTGCAPGDLGEPLACLWRREAFTDPRMALCTWVYSLGGGPTNARMTLKIRVEIRSEFAMKTVINPSFQFVYRLPGRLRENKLCVRLRTVNAPIKSWLYGLLAHTIDAFTLLLIFHPHFESSGLQLSK